jgi:hypothetical protein
MSLMSAGIMKGIGKGLASGGAKIFDAMLKSKLYGVQQQDKTIKAALAQERDILNLALLTGNFGMIEESSLKYQMLTDSLIKGTGMPDFPDQSYPSYLDQSAGMAGAGGIFGNIMAGGAGEMIGGGQTPETIQQYYDADDRMMQIAGMYEKYGQMQQEKARLTKEDKEFKRAKGKLEYINLFNEVFPGKDEKKVKKEDWTPSKVANFSDKTMKSVQEEIGDKYENNIEKMQTPEVQAEIVQKFNEIMTRYKVPKEYHLPTQGTAKKVKGMKYPEVVEEVKKLRPNKTYSQKELADIHEAQNDTQRPLEEVIKRLEDTGVIS